MKIDTFLRDKTYDFALRIIHLSQFLSAETKEDALREALVSSGTIIGARVRNIEFAQSTEEVSALINFCIGEAYQTKQTLTILKEKGCIEDLILNTMMADLEEIIDLLQQITIEATEEN